MMRNVYKYFSLVGWNDVENGHTIWKKYLTEFRQKKSSDSMDISSK
jgi:hypothetical protein